MEVNCILPSKGIGGHMDKRKYGVAYQARVEEGTLRKSIKKGEGNESVTYQARGEEDTFPPHSYVFEVLQVVESNFSSYSVSFQLHI